MQAEIYSSDTLRPVRILGVNDIGYESGNEDMTADQVLPWLQPAAEEGVWTLWQVEYRDVVILGPGNEYLGTFNLTVHDLSDPVEYATLMNELLAVANQ